MPTRPSVGATTAVIAILRSGLRPRTETTKKAAKRRLFLYGEHVLTSREQFRKPVRVHWPFFITHKARRQRYALQAKPLSLGQLKTVTERSWRRCQRNLALITPVERADRFKAILERPDVNTMSEVGRITGEHRSTISRVMKILELPNRILELIRGIQDPELKLKFNEKQLHELRRMKSEQEMLKTIQELTRQS